MQNKFSVQYSIPYKQVLFSDGKEIIWYLPEGKKGCRIMRDKDFTNYFNTEYFFNEINHLIEKITSNNSYVRIKMVKTGFFKEYYRIEFPVDNFNLPISRVMVDIDCKEYYIKGFYFFDNKGSVIFMQEFKNFKRIGKLFFPSESVITIKNEKAKRTIHNYFDNIKLNQEIDDSFFEHKIPEGIEFIPIEKVFYNLF